MQPLNPTRCFAGWARSCVRAKRRCTCFLKLCANETKFVRRTSPFWVHSSAEPRGLHRTPRLGVWPRLKKLGNVGMTPRNADQLSARRTAGFALFTIHRGCRNRRSSGSFLAGSELSLRILPTYWGFRLREIWRQLHALNELKVPFGHIRPVIEEMSSWRKMSSLKWAAIGSTNV